LNPSGSGPAEVYDHYYKEFNPTQYDPDAWLKLAHDAGMRYAVFVAKHHDGFSMYRSAVNPYNVMATPYGKDVAVMFAEACRRQGLALGWQISPKDWKHPDFNTDQHDRYNAFYEKVIEELATQYGSLTTMWFDGIEPIGPEKWKGTPERVAALAGPAVMRAARALALGKASPQPAHYAIATIAGSAGLEERSQVAGVHLPVQVLSLNTEDPKSVLTLRWQAPGATTLSSPTRLRLGLASGG